MPRLDLASIAIGLLITSYTVGAEPASDIPEVIVTATKRETNLQETPVAITAFSQSALDQNLVVDITDTAKFVPGVAFASHGDQAAVTITMRGIGNDSAFTELDSPEVATYINGIYSPRSQGTRRGFRLWEDTSVTAMAGFRAPDTAVCACAAVPVSKSPAKAAQSAIVTIRVIPPIQA